MLDARDLESLTYDPALMSPAHPDLPPALRAALLDPLLWRQLLEPYTQTVHLAVALTDTHGRLLGTCVNPQALWSLLRAQQPATSEECPFCLLPVTPCTSVAEALRTREIVVTHDRVGLTHFAVPLVLGAQPLGALIAGQVFDHYPDWRHLEEGHIAKKFALLPDTFWQTVRQQYPLSRGVLRTYGDLLATVGNNFLRNRYHMLREADRLAELQRVHQHLQESETRFRQLADAMPQIVWTARPDGTVEYYNQRWYEFSGAPEGAGGENGWLSLLHPEDYQHGVTQWRQAVAQTIPYESEGRYHRAADGQYRWFLTRAVPACDATGQVTGWYGTLTDIHDYKQAEEASLRLAAIVESSDDAIISKSLDGTITSWNAAAERIFGYRAEEIRGQSILRLLPEDRHDEERLILERVLQRESINHFETVRRTKEGRLLDVSVTISPLRNKRGTIIGASKIARDITVQKQQVEELAQRAAELERLNAELQQFSYVASHDLQEPLRMITSYMQLLERRSGDKLDAEAQEFMGFVVDGAQRMQRLITDLLAYTRVDGQAREFTAVDCEALLVHVLNDLQLALTDNAAEVTHDPLPTVQGDAGQLGLVLQNLIGNALKFCGEALPRIHLTARREGPQWVLSVRDNGIGIDPRHAERIFQIFQRLHTLGEYPGTGIGLAICKKIVERHGGRIWVVSAPRQGATFYFTVPAGGH